MKKQFIVTYERDGSTICCAYVAESEDQAKAYCNERKPDAVVYEAREDSTNYARRGMPVVTVPDGWTPPVAERETTADSSTAPAENQETSSAATAENLEPLPYEPQPTREEISKADFVRALVFNRSRFLAAINEPTMDAMTLQSSIIPENVERLTARDAKNSV